MRQECGALARQREAAPQERPSRPPRSGVDLGRWEQAAAEQDGAFAGSHPVVWRLAARDGLQRQGMAEDNRPSCVGPQVSEPGPRNETRHGDHESLPLGGHRLQKRLWACVPIAVDQNRASLVQETDVQGAGMQVDAAVQWMLWGVKAPEVAASSWVFSPRPAYHGGMLRRGPQ